MFLLVEYLFVGSLIHGIHAYIYIYIHCINSMYA